MFGFLKNLLGRQAGAPGKSAAGTLSPAPHAGQNATAGAHVQPADPGAPKNGTGHHSLLVEIPLQPVLAALPLTLQPKIKRSNVGDLTLSVPLEKVLAQLAHGAVKITFSELRQAAPDVFTVAPELDAEMVMLPLGEILPRLSPGLIKRRRAQRTIEVPEDISSPFDEAGRTLARAEAPRNTQVYSRTAQSGDTTQFQFQRTPSGDTTHTKFHHANQPAPPSATSPSRTSLTSAPTPEPPTAIPMKSASATPLKEPETVLPSLPPLKLTEPPLPKNSIAPGPDLPAPAHPAGIPLKLPNSTPVPRSAGLPANGNANGNGAAHPNGNSAIPTLPVALAALAEGWTEAVRKEIVQLNLVEAKVCLPREVIERALKQGRVAFTWRMVRSWIKPSPLPSVSAQDGTVLEMPLKVLAPLFLAKRHEAGQSQKKVQIDENIPNLFFGFPQSESAPGGAAATAKPADTNYYVWDDQADTVKLVDGARAAGPSLGTKFVSKYATPNEIVSRAAALDGVAGALIALPDGLLVASRIPADFNGDTLAAFLPQIFGKVSQCTKELRMGDLNNLNFTVGNVPWKIFRVNAIFFAAFGREAQGLPTAQLAALAAELDHKPKAL